MDIYPAIDMKSGKAVRLIQGQFEQVTTYSEDPLKVAERWQAEGAKWLHVVDLDGARTGSPSVQNIEILQRIVRQINLPIQFGGGVRTAEVADQMLSLGVSRCVVGTAVAKDAKLAESLFSVFGDKIAVGVDARDGMVAIQGWQEHIGEHANDFVVRMAGLGAKRFIYTDIARDGMLSGINAVSLAQVACAVPGVSIIASGGVATIEDVLQLKRLRASNCPNIDGVIIGKALYTGGVSLAEALDLALAI